MFPIIALLKNLSRPVAVVLLIAATFLVYLPALGNGFVWDDTALVLRDPLIRSWRLIPEGFRHFLFLDATASNFYRPLQRLTFTADYALFGLGAPWGWHLTSIALHAAAAVALFFLGVKITAGRSGVAFAAALLWAVHPLQTSAVTYVAGRADPLAALFGFTALTLALATLGRERSLGLTLAAAACFLAALLSKESGVVALLVWFVLLIARRAPLRVVGKWLLVAALVLAPYLALRQGAARIAPPAAPPSPFAIRPILAARAVAEYTGLLLAPVTLRMERDISTVPQATHAETLRHARRREYQTLLGLSLALALAAWLVREWRARTVAASCLLGALVAWLPVSNLFPLNATVAEHWLYVPGALFFLAAAAWVAERPKVLRYALPVAGVWLLALMVRTWIRQPDWRDQRTFLEQTIAAGGDTPRMRINLGNLESSAGRHDVALAHFRNAVERAPEQPMAWFGLANAAIRARDFTTARTALEKVGPSPLLAGDLLQSHAVLEHLETGRDTSALLEQAVEIAPRNWGLRRRLIEHLDDRGRTREAAALLTRFLETEAFRADSWALLGRLLEKLGQPATARTAYRQAADRDVRDDASRRRLVALAAAP